MGIRFAASDQLPSLTKAKRTNLFAEVSGRLSDANGKNRTVAEHNDSGRKWQLYRKRYILGV